MRRARRGFTLLELLVVVIIVGVLGAVASALFTGAVRRSREAEPQNLLGNLLLAELGYYTEFDTFTTRLPALDPPPAGADRYNYNVTSASAQSATATIAGSVPATSGMNFTGTVFNDGRRIIARTGAGGGGGGGGGK